nr:ulp1 protease family, C-terminal catalytic domain-containing protein [Tanacetum cinerariifolium]
MLRKKNAEIEAKRIAAEEKAAKDKEEEEETEDNVDNIEKDVEDEEAKSADEEANLVGKHASEHVDNEEDAEENDDKGSIKATRQKVNDILDIPVGNTKLQDLDKRHDNDPFISKWEAQYNHLGKLTPRAIALQMSGTTKADFMFKINFLTLFGSTMGTLKNSGRVPKSNKKLEHSDDEKKNHDETSKGCLGNIEHHEDFDPDEEQNGIDLYKGLDVSIEPLSERKPVTKEEFYEKIIEKFTKISEERSELIETLREGMTKFGEDQGIFDFYDQYKNLFKDAEFNLYDSSMDEYSESESDADNNKKNDDEKVKEKRNDISKGTEEAGKEQKDDEEDDQDDLNNEHEFENMTGDDREVAFSMEVDESENKKEKKTEIMKEQEAEKKEKQAENEEKQDDIGKGTEEAGSKTKNNEDETKDMFNWKKANGNYDEQFEAFSKTIKSEFKNDPEMKNMKDLKMKKLFSMHFEKLKHPRAKDVLNKNPTIIRPKWGTKENDTDCGIFLMMHMEHYNGETTKSWNLEFPTGKEGNTLDIIKMRPRLATKILSHEINIHREKMSTEAQEFARRNTDKNLRKKMIKEAFNWKKANGNYDEQFEAFSKTIKSEFKNDPEMKNMKDLKM